MSYCTVRMCLLVKRDINQSRDCILERDMDYAATLALFLLIVQGLPG